MAGRPPLLPPPRDPLPYFPQRLRHFGSAQAVEGVSKAGTQRIYDRFHGTG